MSTAEAEEQTEEAEEWDRGAPPRTAEQRKGLARGLEPRNKRQPTSNKKESEERKKERVRNANNDDGEAKEEAKEEAKRSKQSKQSTIWNNNDNQPDRNSGNLPGGWRQPLNAAADSPNPPSSISEVAEVIENRKVSFGESVDARN
jgi:hypothetical protein